MRPRTGKLKEIERSDPKLSAAEEEAAHNFFYSYSIVDQSEFIQKDELRSLLLTLNLNLSTLQLADYIEALNGEIGSES